MTTDGNLQTHPCPTIYTPDCRPRPARTPNRRHTSTLTSYFKMAQLQRTATVPCGWEELGEQQHAAQVTLLAGARRVGRTFAQSRDRQVSGKHTEDGVVDEPDLPVLRQHTAADRAFLVVRRESQVRVDVVAPVSGLRYLVQQFGLGASDDEPGIDDGDLECESRRVLVRAGVLQLGVALNRPLLKSGSHIR